jgi:hypothetical protein
MDGIKATPMPYHCHQYGHDEMIRSGVVIAMGCKSGGATLNYAELLFPQDDANDAGCSRKLDVAKTQYKQVQRATGPKLRLRR